MNTDLEEQLKEMGPAAASLVGRLRAAPVADTSAGFTARAVAAAKASGSVPAVRRAAADGFRRSPNWWAAAAAAVVVLLAAHALFRVGRPVPIDVSSVQYLVSLQRPDGTFSGSSAAPYVQAVVVQALSRGATAVPERAPLESAVAALVRTQAPAGGWGNDVLSAWNVAALCAASAAGVDAARVPYRRGLRYLRSRGIPEVTPAAFSRELRAWLGRSSGAEDPALRAASSLLLARN